ncbi:MAG TPA: PP0621 family protein [Methylophilaceae bacterium]|nr:PP0621 family protein [Methylophilaceae bacterium]
MAKIFLLAIAIWLVITILKRYFKNLEVSSKSADRPPEKSEPEEMVQCAHCGVHLPTSDSLLVGNQYYCCEAHSTAAHAAPPKP